MLYDNGFCKLLSFKCVCHFASTWQSGGKVVKCQAGACPPVLCFKIIKDLKTILQHNTEERK